MITKTRQDDASLALRLSVITPIHPKKQMRAISEILGINYPDVEFPHLTDDLDITGIAVSVDSKMLSSRYDMAVHQLLKKVSGILHLHRPLDGRMIGNLEIDEYTQKCLEDCKSRKDWPFIMFPINTAGRWVHSPLSAKMKMQKETAGEYREFPIDSFSGLLFFAVHFLTQPHHMAEAIRTVVLPNFAGDLYKPAKDCNGYAFNTRLQVDSCGLSFKEVRRKRVETGIDFGRYSSWSGFVRRNEA